MMFTEVLHIIQSCSLVVVAVSFFFIALFYHMLFKPDYRPGHVTLPFIWYPWISSMYKNSQRIPVFAPYYNIQILAGLCKVFEKQKIFSFSLLGKNYVFLFRPEDFEVILSSPKIINKSSDYDKVKSLMKDGLFMSNGQKWRHRRKLLTHTFHFKILQCYASLMKDISKDVVLKIQESVNEPFINAEILFRLISNTVLMKTAFGMDRDAETDNNIEVLNVIPKSLTLFHRRIVRPWLLPDFIYKFSSLAKENDRYCETLHRYIKKKISEKKQNMLLSRQRSAENGAETNGHIPVTNGHIPVANGTQSTEGVSENKGKHKAFLDSLLELHFNDNSFTEEDILEECISFFAGGVLSTGSALSYVLYCIGLYKDVQERLHEEIDEIVGETNRDLTEEDINKWKYLECVIKETLRLYGTLTFSREATEDTKVGDYTILKGSIVVLFYAQLHRNPIVFPDPEKFDPSRFFPENSIGRSPYAFVPFSAGPRNCIGQRFAMMELKTVISTIVRWFDLDSLDDVDQLMDVNRLKNETEITIRMKFTPRKNIKHFMSHIESLNIKAKNE